MNLEALEHYLSEERTPTELANTLEEMLFDYIDKLLRLELLSNDYSHLHTNSPHFIAMLREFILLMRNCTNSD